MDRYHVKGLMGRVGMAAIVTAALLGLHCRGEEPIGSTPAVSKLEITVARIPSKQGAIMLALFDSKETFARKATAAGKVKVTGDIAVWVVKDLQPGRYALALYHDENGNGKLDKNLLGIPTEAYGFSNNARGRFGVPSWANASFKVGPGLTKHSVALGGH